MTAYFLEKKWNKYEDTYGSHGMYWDLLSQDLTEFIGTIKSMQAEYEASEHELTFVEYYLDRWTLNGTSGAATSIVVEKKPDWYKDWLQVRVGQRMNRKSA